MAVGKQLKYGHIRGGEQGYDVTIKATQYIAAASGKFVRGSTTATSNLVTFATLADTDVLGAVECEELDSSDGTEVRKCISDYTAVWRIPIVAGTYYHYLKGKKCDLKIVSNIQGACLNSATDVTLIIEDGDEDNNNWVDVRLNPSRVFNGVV